MSGAGKELAIPETAADVLKRFPANSLPAMMAQNHPLHGLFAAAFEDLGGFGRLTEWIAEDSKNYEFFLKMLVKMTPPPSSDVTVREMNITVNGKLRPTPLDGELVE